MSDLFDIPANIAERCLIDPAQYQSMYKRIIEIPMPFGPSKLARF